MPSKTEEYLALAQRTANGLTRYWESSSAIFVYRVWVFLVVSFSGHSLMESIFSRFPYGSSFHFAPSLFSILRIQYTTPNPIVKEDMYAARRRPPLFSR